MFPTKAKPLNPSSKQIDKELLVMKRKFIKDNGECGGISHIQEGSRNKDGNVHLNGKNGTDYLAFNANWSFTYVPIGLC